MHSRAIQESLTTIGDICSPEINAVTSTDSLLTALTLMREKDYSQLPVLTDHRYTGSIRERTLASLIVSGAHLDTTLSTCQLESVFDEHDHAESIANAVMWFDREVPAVLVTEDDRVIGILTAWDVMHYSRIFIWIQELERATRAFTLQMLNRQYGTSWLRSGRFPMSKVSHVIDMLKRNAEDVEHTATSREAVYLSHASLKNCRVLLNTTVGRHSSDTYRRINTLLDEAVDTRNLAFHTQTVPEETMSRFQEVAEELQGLYEIALQPTNSRPQPSTR
jgi:hypothetical protein